jgi:hypothetical protein
MEIFLEGKSRIPEMNMNINQTGRTICPFKSMVSSAWAGNFLMETISHL